MKVIGINGSPHTNGNTAALINTVFAELQKDGIETELIQLSEAKIQGCRACWVCRERRDGLCAVKGDGFNECFAKVVEADGIILGSPVYSADVTSQMKAFIDRASVVCAVNKGILRRKVGASVVAARRGGAISTFNTMNNFLYSKEIFLVGSTYWNMAYGMEAGEVENDAEGMANMVNLGQNMAWLLKRVRDER